MHAFAAGRLYMYLARQFCQISHGNATWCHSQIHIAISVFEPVGICGMQMAFPLWQIERCDCHLHYVIRGTICDLMHAFLGGRPLVTEIRLFFHRTGNIKSAFFVNRSGWH